MIHLQMLVSLVEEEIKEEILEAKEAGGIETNVQEVESLIQTLERKRKNQEVAEIETQVGLELIDLVEEKRRCFK